MLAQPLSGPRQYGSRRQKQEREERLLVSNDSATQAPHVGFNLVRVVVPLSRESSSA
jgi:hypothetical protein